MLDFSDYVFDNVVKEPVEPRPEASDVAKQYAVEDRRGCLFAVYSSDEEYPTNHAIRIGDLNNVLLELVATNAFDCDLTYAIDAWVFEFRDGAAVVDRYWEFDKDENGWRRMDKSR
jgi:hypothetical protein